MATEHEKFLRYAIAYGRTIAVFTRSSFRPETFFLNRQSCVERAVNRKDLFLPAEETERALSTWPEEEKL